MCTTPLDPSRTTRAPRARELYRDAQTKSRSSSRPFHSIVIQPSLHLFIRTHAENQYPALRAGRVAGRFPENFPRGVPVWADICFFFVSLFQFIFER